VLTNAIVLGREVDTHFPQHQLIVELDTETRHSDPNSFERDRDSDATALAHGINTVRITGHREERRLRATLGICPADGIWLRRAG
jgi:very-short-patch-repair endonuclease